MGPRGQVLPRRVVVVEALRERVDERDERVGQRECHVPTLPLRSGGRLIVLAHLAAVCLQALESSCTLYLVGRGRTLTWLGHAAFRLDTPAGTRVYVDPFLTGNPSCPDAEREPERCDLVVVTHGHDDHVGDAVAIGKRFSCPVVAQVELRGRLAGQGLAQDMGQAPNKGGTVRFGDVRVTLTDANHSSSTFESGAFLYLGESCGVVLRLDDGPTIYVAGDTNVFGDMALIRRLYAPDVAVLPIGDHFTMGPGGGGGRRGARRRSARRPLPLRDVPDPERDARRAPTAPSRRGRAARSGPGRDARPVRERWFGATGRRVPAIALEGSVDVEGALVRRGRRRRRSAPRGTRRRHPRRRPGGRRRGRRAGARSARGGVCARHRSRAARARPPRADVWLSRSLRTRSAPATSTAGQWGVATQSKFLAVGSIVPWAAPHVGAIATQSYANPRYGPDGLALLREGLSAAEVVERLTAADDGRASRQLGVVDAEGGAATYTGEGCHAWAGGHAGDGYAAQGNILVSAATVDALAETFDDGAGKPLSARLLDALDAAEAAGGDRRGRQSAALLVVERDAGYAGPLGHARRSPRRRPRRPARRAAPAPRPARGALRGGRRAISGYRSTLRSGRSSTSSSHARATRASLPGLESRTSRSAWRARRRSTPSCSSA